MPGLSSLSSTSLSPPIVCALCARVSTSNSAMRDLQPGLEEAGEEKRVGFSALGKGETDTQSSVPRQSHFFRPGQLRATLLTPWS